jgi:hypothetical protein
LPLPFYAYILFCFVLPHGFHEEFLMRKQKRRKIPKELEVTLTPNKKVSPVLVVRMP